MHKIVFLKFMMGICINEADFVYHIVPNGRIYIFTICQRQWQKFFFFVESEMLLKLMVMASGELVYSSPLKGEENKANEISWEQDNLSTVVAGRIIGWA